MPGANHSVSVPSGRTVVYGGVAPPVPAWLSAIEVGHWGTVGANTLAAIDPEDNAAINPNHPADAPWHGIGGLSTIVTAWCGGAYDVSGQVFYIHGGGHGDYAGNEVFAIDLSDAAPAWSMLINPTGAIGNTGTLDDGLEASAVYFDNRPRSVHSYNTMLVVNGSIYRIPTGSQYQIGSGNVACFRFDPSPTNDWTRLADRPAGGGGFGGACHVPGAGNGRIFTFPNDNNVPHSYDIDANTWATHTNQFTNAGTYVRPIYDAPSNRILLFSSDYGAGKVGVVNPDAVASPTNLTTTGTAPTISPAHGTQYDSVNDVYLCWEGGTGIKRLTPPASGDRATGTWTWDTLAADAGNAVTPSSPTSNGTFNRCFYDPALQVFGVLNSISEQIYVRRLG